MTPRPDPALAAGDLSPPERDVTLVGDLEMPGARTDRRLPRGAALTELAAGAVVAQHIAVGIARARGIEPGTFAYGQKVTTPCDQPISAPPGHPATVTVGVDLGGTGTRIVALDHAAFRAHAISAATADGTGPGQPG